MAVFVFGLLYMSRDSLPCATYMGFFKTQMISLALMAALAGAFLWQNRKDLKTILRDRRLWLAGISAAIVLVPMVVKQDWQLMYFTVLIGIFLSILLSFIMPVREMARYYVVIMAALAAFSLVAHYCLRPLGEAGLIPSPIVVNSFGAEFYNYIFSFPTLLWYTKMRNYGIFREPGVYQYFLLLALYLNNYRVDWQKNRNLWIVNAVLTLTMLSTLATGGVIELGLLAGVLYLDRKWYRTRQGQLLALACVGAVIAGLLFLYVTKNPLLGDIYLMIAKLWGDEDSMVDRMGSLAVNMGYFFRSPLVGAPISQVLYAVENNTSSTTVLFAILGLLGGGFHVLAWAALVWDKERFLLWNLGLLAIVLMSFNTQNLITNPFLWIFPVMGLEQRICGEKV